jgi:hypothetical protein
MVMAAEQADVDVSIVSIVIALSISLQRYNFSVKYGNIFVFFHKNKGK